MTSSTRPNPQEIYLLELFISAEYFARLRDMWAEMIDHVEHCLNHFMHQLPQDYRKRPLPEQPDIAWGERILPNFRATSQHLSSGVIAVSHGDMIGLREANRVLNDFKGQREFSSDWMAAADADRYSTLLNAANALAGNIAATEEPYWVPGDLTTHLDEATLSELPSTLPTYDLDRSVTVQTGAVVKQYGIYVPDVRQSCAQYLNNYNEAPPAIAIRGDANPADGGPAQQEGDDGEAQDVACTWTRVRRMPGQGVLDPS